MSGVGFAILTRCIESTNADDKSLVPTSDDQDWTRALTNSPLVCDLDFVSDTPTAVISSNSLALGNDAFATAVWSYSNRQLSPCGAITAFDVPYLSAGQALMEVSNCRMQVDGMGSLPVAVKHSKLKWIGPHGQVHVTMDVSETKSRYFKMMQDQRLETKFIWTRDDHYEQGTGVCALWSCDMLSETNPPPIESWPGATQAHSVHDMDALHNLKLLVQDEMDDMHHVLVAMGMAAIVLVVIFCWTLWQIYKPKPKATVTYLRMPQQPQPQHYENMKPQIVGPVHSASHFYPTAPVVGMPHHDNSTSGTNEASMSPSSKLEHRLKEKELALEQGHRPRPRRIITPGSLRSKNPFVMTDPVITPRKVASPERAHSKSMGTTKTTAMDASKNQSKLGVAAQEGLPLPVVVTPERRDDNVATSQSANMHCTRDNEGTMEDVAGFVQDYWASKRD